MFRKKRSSKQSPLKRLLRSTIAILVLSALVGGVSFVVKEMSTLNNQKFYKLAQPVLDKLNVDEDTAGQVAGEFVERISNTGITSPSQETKNGTTNVRSDSPIYTVGLFADSGNDFDHLDNALEDVKQKDIDLLVHLGDLTDWGDINSLQEVKDRLDNSRLQWFSLPGDHDLGESVGLENYLRVFGSNKFLFDSGKVTLLGFDNSANYTAITESDLNWLERNITQADVILLSQPVYNPKGLVKMGTVNGDVVEEVEEQSKRILSIIRDSNATVVVSADQHLFSKTQDVVDSELTHYILGAIAEERNLQSPRYALLKVYYDGEIVVEQVVL